MAGISTGDHMRTIEQVRKLCSDFFAVEEPLRQDIWLQHFACRAQTGVSLVLHVVPEEVNTVAILRLMVFLATARRISDMRVSEVMAYGERFGIPYFITFPQREYRPLYDVVADNGRLSVPVAVRVAVDIAEALHEAHKWNLMHGELHPGSIGTTTDGHAAITAFHELFLRYDPEPGTVYGHPSYISPELIRGEPKTVATDVYGVGALLYFCLTGQPPFDGSPEKLAATLGADRPRPSDVADVPSGLDEIVIRAMAVDSSDRFPTLASLQDELIIFGEW